MAGTLGSTGRVRRLGSVLLAPVLLAVLLGVSSSPAGAVAGYGDVADDQYFTEPVQWSVDNDITGIDGPCFSPDAPASRGETALYLWNMQGQPEAGEHSFVDVTVDAHNDAISWMAATGITTGTSPTTFSPDDTLTRAQVAAFLWRLAGVPAAPAHSFVDVHAAWQQGAVSWLAQTGITTGTSLTTFSPDNTLTRKQLITFLWRYQDRPDVTVDPASPDCDPDAPVPMPSDGFAVIDPTDDDNRDDDNPTDDDTPTDEDAPDDDDTPDDNGNLAFRDDVLIPDSSPTTLLGSSGDLRVKLHVCVDPDLASLVSISDIAATADSWNELEAPFYNWQSSGLLNMRMEAGMIIDSQNLDDHGVADPFPADCTAVLSREAGIIHHLFNFIEGTCVGAGGFGMLNFGLSSTCVSNSSRLSRSLVDLFRSLFGVISHELDHNIGIEHAYGFARGYTRVIDPPPPDADPDNLRERYFGTRTGMPTGNDTSFGRVYRCYDLEALGWPMGDDKPACFRMPPRVDLFSGERTADGRVRFQWEYAYTTEPVTSQRIHLRRWEAQADGTFAWTEVDSYSVPTDAKSFILPSHPGGFYQVSLVHSWAFGSAYAWSGSIHDKAFSLRRDVGIEVAQRPTLEQIGFDLNWTPAPGVSEYKVSGYRGCLSVVDPEPPQGRYYRDEHGARLILSPSIERVVTEPPNCNTDVSEPGFSLDEASGKLRDGNSYDIVIEACAPPETHDWGIIGLDRCYVWATTTVAAKPYEPTTEEVLSIGLYRESWRYTRSIPPCDRVSAQEECCDLAPRDCLETGIGPAYYIAWDHHPEAGFYFLRFRECEATRSQCLQEGFDLTNPNSYTSNLVSRDEVGERIYVFSDYGQQYLLDVLVCPEGLDPENFDGRQCFPWEETRTTFTTLTRNN